MMYVNATSTCLNTREIVASAVAERFNGDKRFASSVRDAIVSLGHDDWHTLCQDDLETLLGLFADACLEALGTGIELNRLTVTAMGQALSRILRDCPLVSGYKVASGADDVKPESIQKKGSNASFCKRQSRPLNDREDTYRVVYFAYTVGKTQADHDAALPLVADLADPDRIASQEATTAARLPAENAGVDRTTDIAIIGGLRRTLDAEQASHSRTRRVRDDHKVRAWLALLALRAARNEARALRAALNSSIELSQGMRRKAHSRV